MKSTFNQTKLNLAKKIKNLKNGKKQKNSARKESELECFKRIKVSQIPLSLGVHPKELKKKLTDPSSTEVDRVYSRVLLNQRVQGTITELTDSYGLEFVEQFLKDNEKNIKKNKNKKLHKQPAKKSKALKETSSESESEISDNESEVSDNEELIPENKAISNPEIPEPKKEKTVKIKKPRSIPADGVKQSGLNSHAAKAKKSVDPFFVSSGGENYFASVHAINSSSSEDDEPKNKKVKPKSGQKVSKEVKKQMAGHKKNGKEPKAQFSKPPPAKHEVKSARIQEPLMVVKPAAKENPETTSSSSELHPSWIAKAQMRQLQIQEFKGTKIKFDD